MVRASRARSLMTPRASVKVQAQSSTQLDLSPLTTVLARTSRALPSAYGVVVYGTDGHGDWINRCHVDWERAGVQARLRYTGSEANSRYSLQERSEQHVPMFEKVARQAGLQYVSEWWVRFMNEQTERATSGTTFETVIHVNKDNLFLKGVLLCAIAMLPRLLGSQAKNRAGSVTIKSDLPASRIPNDFLVETILPFKFAPESRYTDPGGIWFHSTRVALGFSQIVERTLAANTQG